MTTNPRKALIYCRVSSQKQETDGHGLDSQESRCRQYAAAKGYKVMLVCPDTYTGGGDFMNRPGMVQLLAFLDANPDEDFVVIFDDLKRYARDVEFHLKLRREMDRGGATRECLNFNFQDTPEGRFHETIIAATGQLEREQNGRQVAQKMRVRTELGYWVSPRAHGLSLCDRQRAWAHDGARRPFKRRWKATHLAASRPRRRCSGSSPIDLNFPAARRVVSARSV